MCSLHYQREMRQHSLGLRLVRQYGITPDDYQRLNDEQGGVCAICKRDQRDGKRLAVDHNHETGAVRGLLCAHCNMGLGQLGDTPEHLRAALAYLEK
jgi:hypothetical protein